MIWPKTPLAIVRSRFFVTFIDNFSNFTMVNLMKNFDEISDFIIKVNINQEILLVFVNGKYF